MPITAVMFLIGSMAIAGIPPFNGFVSEFIIYNGLFKGLLGTQGISQSILIILTITGLAIAGGLSLITFTKSFGIIFLGNSRKVLEHEPEETSFIMLLPQFLIVAAMFSVALAPAFFFDYAIKVVTGAFSLQISNLSGSVCPIPASAGQSARRAYLSRGQKGAAGSEDLRGGLCQ